jgi:hypothetical protein
MTHHPRRLAFLILTPALALSFAACSTGAAPSSAPSSAPSGGPSAAPSETPAGSPTSGGIQHKTGATDVILRYGETGSMMFGAVATEIPHFTLYGDGTVIFRNPMLEMPAPQGSVVMSNPMRTAALSEEQIQELLALALGEGGLAAARENYPNDMVADASTAVFTIDAGGIQKTVSVYALGPDAPNAADAQARASFQKLADALADFDQGGSIPTDAYVPEQYRGVLLESPGMQAPDLRAWPWADLTVADFKPAADPNGLQFPHRSMTPAEIDQLDVTDYEGGFQGLPLQGTDDKLYTMSLRPLLPDDES